MDLIRIYAEIVFSRVAESFLSNKGTDASRESLLILPEEFFLDQGRRHHPELSDDNLKMIYRLGFDEWSEYGYARKCGNQKNIFQTLAFFACEMLEDERDEPLVRFRDLFRWRDTSQILGEDLLTCAFLAFMDRELIENSGRSFEWPSVLHNDNPHLTYLFKTKRLCELHSHLNASANVYEITWVSLMNYISGLQDKFEHLAEIHIPSRKKEIGQELYQRVVEASCLRWSIFQWLKSGNSDIWSGNQDNHDDSVFFRCLGLFENKTLDDRAEMADSNSQTERNGQENNGPDYIIVTDSPMAVYAGERWFLYNTLKRIFATNNANITNAFYRYVLAKSLLRSYFIQINNNIGFANFQRYQNVKSMLLSPQYGYSRLLKSLPLWEARTYNYVKVFETRVTPDDPKGRSVARTISNARERLGKEKEAITSFFKDRLTETGLLPGSDSPEVKDWSLIFHFIKQKTGTDSTQSRDTALREKLERQSKMLKSLDGMLTAPAVDAASSELAARPEVFSQAFRFLRYYGYKVTFHAGEDFYDISDGLRAIDEAIHLLKLKASDRLGHALALGIDARQYYVRRHNYIALPKQWMLDNVVWIIMRSKEFGITIAPQIERFLENTYKDLCIEIGYNGPQQSRSGIPYMEDYWESMVLRGDSPHAYNEDGVILRNHASQPGEWEYYSLLDSGYAENVRSRNTEAVKLYYYYHHSTREKGEAKQQSWEVKSFRLPEGYADLMTALQECMIKEVSKRLLCIECCPSSNVKIGKLERFDAHPIFRFMPLDSSKTRYPLAVTVNTDDLGVFATSLPNEFSLLALALLKMKDSKENHIYSNQEVYDWIRRVIENGHKFTFLKQEPESYPTRINNTANTTL